MKIKKTLIPLALLPALASSLSADLLISGMVDGTQTGGIPKAMEIVAETDIPDLSAFFISRDTNGAGPWDTFVQLPAVSLSAGDFFYVYGNVDSNTVMAALGFPADTTNSAFTDAILNWNGDDILGLSTSNSPAGVFDSFGQVAQGDTNFAADSISYRQPSTPANAAGVFDAGNFDITAYSDAELQATFGTYVIPEPGTYAAILGLLGLGFVLIRRRKA